MLTDNNMNFSEIDVLIVLEEFATVNPADDSNICEKNQSRSGKWHSGKCKN